MASTQLLKDLMLDVWLLEQLQKVHDTDPGLTLEELQARWMNNPRHKCKLSRSTMSRHRIMIQELFGVVIEPKDKKHYKITNPKALSLDSLANDLLASLQEYLFLDEYRDLGDAIMPQQIWEGLEYLHVIGDAIRGHNKLSIQYKKFLDEEPYDAIIHPYCLKASQGRWYILAEKENGKHLAQTFALDRIRSLHALEDTYDVNPAINVSTYFNDAFGIWVDPEKYPVQDIVVGIQKDKSKYWTTLPLHHSQKMIGEENGKVLFRFHIGMTPDFLGELKRWDVSQEDIRIINE